jgi:lipid A 4'-phosphatase
MKFAVVAGFVMALVLACVPDLDLAASRAFYAGDGHFVGKEPAGFIARDIARLTPFFLLGGLALLHLGRRLGWLAARYAPDGGSLAFLALSLALGPGLIVDGVLKDNVHRPRPVEVREFGGKLDFQPYYRLAGPCQRNCSFPSGEAAAGFWLGAPASLAPLPLRPVLIAAALLFGAAAGLLRMSFGGHFLSDVVCGGLITLVVIAWLRRLFRLAPEPKRASKADQASPPVSESSIAPIP